MGREPPEDLRKQLFALRRLARQYVAEYMEVPPQPNVYKTFLHKFGRWLLRVPSASYAEQSR